jgi:hypothetical protein
MYNYSPKFLWTVKSSDSKSDIFIELSYFDILIFGMGLKFLSTDTKKYKAFNVENYIENTNQIPLVVFPENTKTNREGVLNIRSNNMDTLYRLINIHGKLLYRSEIFVKKYKYFTTYNTTEYYGLKNLILTASQIYNTVEIYSQDIPNVNFEKNTNCERNKYKTNEEYFDDNLQSLLHYPSHRNNVSSTSVDHISFLGYFHATNTHTKYVTKEE